MADIWNVDWYSRNSQRLFPISSAATGRDATDSISFPQDLVVDLNITASFDYDPEDFYLPYLDVYQNGVIIAVGYEASLIAAVDIPYSTTLPQSYRFSSSAGDVTGAMTVFSLRNVQQQTPAGRWLFNLEDTRIEPCQVNIMPKGVSSITVRTAIGDTDPLTGNIVLLMGTNTYWAGNASGGTLRLDVYDVEEFVICSNCPPSSIPITSFNGVSTTDGNFNIIASTCVEPEATDTGLKLNDQCSEPQCGSQEYQTLAEAIRVIEREHNALTKLAERLEQNMQSFRDVMLASKLSDIACQASTTTTP